MTSRRVFTLVAATVVAILLAVGAWMTWGPRPLTPEQRDAVAQQLLSGLRVSVTVSDSSLAVTKALIDFLPENDVRLVVVRIVDDLELELRIEADDPITFNEPPSFCLIGPFAAPDDAGLSDPCWGTPEEFVTAHMDTDGGGHAVLGAGGPTTVLASLQRGGGRCDYPPGQWILRVVADPLVDGRPTGSRRLPEIGFEIPYTAGEALPLIAVDAANYCGLANVVYREQGEPEVASPSP